MPPGTPLPRGAPGDYPATVQIEAAKAMRPGTPRWHHYAIAVGSCVLALMLRMALDPWLGGQPALIIFIFPIIISAYLGGLGPGLLATAIAGALTAIFILPPERSFWVHRPIEASQW